MEMTRHIKHIKKHIKDNSESLCAKSWAGDKLSMVEYMKSQHLGGRTRRIPTSSKLAWSTELVLNRPGTVKATHEGPRLNIVLALFSWKTHLGVKLFLERKVGELPIVPQHFIRTWLKYPLCQQPGSTSPVTVFLLHTREGVGFPACTHSSHESAVGFTNSAKSGCYRLKGAGPGPPRACEHFPGTASSDERLSSRS